MDHGRFIKSHAIDFMTLSEDKIMSRYPPKCKGNETFVVHRMDIHRPPGYCLVVEYQNRQLLPSLTTFAVAELCSGE